jgi:SAM-dependent methyltransferase
MEYRKTGDAFPVLQRYFGLGLAVTSEELMAEGFSEELAREVIELYPAVSRNGEIFIAHAHWPAQPGKDYVYLGEESFELLKQIEECPDGLDGFQNASVLDLGCGSGALLLQVASCVAQGLGMDLSQKAVRWAQASALAQDFGHLQFRAASIGSPEAETVVQGKEWNAAIMNPPFAIPTETESRPHRDGGALGIELPLLFLQYAARHLVSDGEVFSLITNPIVQGRPAFFDRLDRKVWKVVDKKCLHDQFNHSLYRKERYAERGIQRVELWFLRLKKS